MKRLAPVLLLILAAASPAPLRTRHGMVASSSEIASQIGVDIMKKGGNAVDAAIAVAFAEAVTWPAAGNIGGGGFMLIRMADGTTDAIDYRERAPLASTRDMYVDSNGKVIKGATTDGYRASGVPGTVAGLVVAHKRHGKLPWRDLVEPARKLAADGFIVSDYLGRVFAEKETNQKLSPWPESRRIFLRDGKLYQMGERFKQPELAATLARIEENPRDFYEGVTAKRIVADMKGHGGLITEKDLATYEATVRTSLAGSYRGHDLIMMPPPSSGGIGLVEMLHMLEPYDVAAMPFQSAQQIHLQVEVMRRFFADRVQYISDPDFTTVPVARLTSREFAVERAKTIDMQHASKSADIGPGNVAAAEPSHTTHFAIVDKDGAMVSNTYTINDWFGSGVTAKGTGVLLNDEMDDFTAQPGVPNVYGLLQGEQNSIQPRKRPLSSMTPLIMLKDGKPWVAVGAAGGPRIITTILQIVIEMVDYGMDLQEALDVPRVHHQWMPDEIWWEPRGVNADTRAILEKMGHTFRDHASNLSDANAVEIEPATGLRVGASDPRRGGVPVGY